MRVVVTGGAGFIGAHLCRALASRGDDVVAFDDLSTGRAEAVAGLPLRVGDVLDQAALADVVGGADAVVHLAARSSVPRSIDDPVGAMRVNAGGAVALASVARAVGLRRLVYASSSSVYGDDPVLPRREDRPLQPLSPYAASKAAAEWVFRGLSMASDTSTVGLRFFNVYGPGQRAEGPYAQAVPRFLAAALAGRPATLFGDGRDTRDYSFVEDVVAAVIAAVDRAPSVSGRVFNVAGGVETSTLALHRLVGEAVGCAVPPEHQAARRGDQRRSVADLSAVRECLDWSPRVGLAEGLRRTAAAVR
jgi:UDP-glucose 4-epimerase